MDINLRIDNELLKRGGHSEKDVKMVLGVALYNNKVASTGKIAEILDIDRRSFLEDMGKYGGILFNETPEEFREGNKNAAKFVK